MLETINRYCSLTENPAFGQERICGVRFVAKKWLLSGPYLYKVPDSMTTRKYLQKQA